MEETMFAKMDTIRYVLISLDEWMSAISCNYITIICQGIPEYLVKVIK